MSNDSSFAVKADNSRVLMSDVLQGVVDEVDPLPPEVTENFVSVIINVSFTSDVEAIVGTLVGVRKEEHNIVLSAKLMYDDALRFISENVYDVNSFELYYGIDKSKKFVGPWKLSASEMFDVNPAVGMCTVALELNTVR